MKTLKIYKNVRRHLADMVTPVSIVLNVRNIYPDVVLLESADYHGATDSFSFVCMHSLASFRVDNNVITRQLLNDVQQHDVQKPTDVPDHLQNFINSISVSGGSEFTNVDGIFGYTAYNAQRYFDTLHVGKKRVAAHSLPDMRYHFYRYIVAINHFRNQMYVIENLPSGERSQLDDIVKLIHRIDYQTSQFSLVGNETSNISDAEYMYMVERGKHHCKIGDVFQIVLSRQFSRGYTGDDFQAYRALRYINPSPYLFYFNYDGYRIFGSSPEAQLRVDKGKAIINPIAGTFRRTGNDRADEELAQRLAADPKENAEHVMLVDLARNDLSRSCQNVTVDVYKDIQFFSHVIHLVSTVSGTLKEGENPFRLFANTFPAGTLSGAPKYKAMELIEEYENQDRGYYGGAIGFFGLNGSINHAIMIRSFLSTNNRLFYQAGAGVVFKSEETGELNEVNNKLAALRKALETAVEL